ncbi:hypothetical protein GBA52_005732 [Prunus armeniaca]|nr:hypothetical protein GBA52_005732 [Prunus armeniaca]
MSVLNLSSNQLTGKIPNEIRNMTRLTPLDLFDNNFISKLPTDSQFMVFNDMSFAGSEIEQKAKEMSAKGIHY